MNKKNKENVFNAPIKIEIELTDEMLNQIANRTASIIELNSKNEVHSRKPIFYTVKEAAEIAKRSSDTISRHIRDGLLKASKTGKCWIISEENYNNYINNLQ